MKSKKDPYLLLSVGLILISLSVGLSFLFSYYIKTEHIIDREFRMTEEPEKRYIIEILKDVTSVSYELLINATTGVEITVEIVGDNGLILDSERRVMAHTGNLSKRVSVDGLLEQIIVSLKKNETKMVSGKIQVRYIENLGSQLFFTLILAFIGIAGTIITAFGLILYFMQKGFCRHQD